MSSVYQEIKATLESPGMKHIVWALRSYHKSQWRSLRDCPPERLQEIQSVMKAIDTALPLIIETLMNKHLDPKKDKDPSLWFRFNEYASQIKGRVPEEFNPLTHIKVMAADEGSEGYEVIVPVGYDPSISCVQEGKNRFDAVLPDGRTYPIIRFPFGVVYDGIVRRHGISPWRNGNR